ncbi:MAG: 2-amino-4-hydroxy-6-hydroxymethyldihydropteridine diphosphokinase [Chloroflexi bacterium]|nr:2-amino-4-hydroxy-6-hydroxymethyldihydropteridine diphosphokinase [Chloroflexota bacterium]
MNEFSRAYLSIGSNIEPEVHLPRALSMLRERGTVASTSSVWESRAVNSSGPNFLNACASFLTLLPPVEVKEQVIRPIEASLGRVRSADRNAPRTIDLDIVLYDDQPLNVDFWEYAFVIVPLAELVPGFIHPLRSETLARVSAQVQEQVWIVRRGEVLLS